MDGCIRFSICVFAKRGKKNIFFELGSRTRKEIQQLSALLIHVLSFYLSAASRHPLKSFLNLCRTTFLFLSHFSLRFKIEDDSKQERKPKKDKNETRKVVHHIWHEYMLDKTEKYIDSRRFARIKAMINHLIM